MIPKKHRLIGISLSAWITLVASSVVVCAEKGTQANGLEPLYYFQQSNKICEWKGWLPGSAESPETILTLKKCPNKAFLAKPSNKLILITGDTIQEVTFHPTVSVKKPVTMIPESDSRLAGRQLHKAGLLDSKLAVVYLWHGGGPEGGYDCNTDIYAHEKKGWEFQKSLGWICEDGLYASDVPEEFSGVSVSDIGLDNDLLYTAPNVMGLDPNFRKNKFLNAQGCARKIGQEFKIILCPKEDQQEGLYYKRFQFGSDMTTLYYEVGFGDTPHTMAINLETSKEKKPRPLRGDGQYDAQIRGQYLLVYDEYEGTNADLINLETGEPALQEPILLPMWMKKGE